MQIFRRKPFMLCCFCFIISAVTSFFVAGVVKIIAAFTVLGLALATVILLVCLKKRDVRIRLAVLLVALIMSGVSFGESYFYYDVYSSAFEPYIGEMPVIADVTLLKERNYDTHYAEYLVRVNSVNGDPFDSKAILRVEGEAGVSVGQKVEVIAQCVALDEYALTKSARLSYVSDGILGAFSVDEEHSHTIKINERINGFSFSELNDRITYRTEFLLDGEPCRLAMAMLLGRRDRLSETTERDFSRAGISHMLALSGLHLAVLTGAFDLILRKFGVPKLIRCCLLPPVMLGYLCLTGFALSTVRAAVMLTAVYFAFIIASPIDKMTVLFASCTAILALSPSAVADIGFWMSYLATFGLILMSPHISGIFRKLKTSGASLSPKALFFALLKSIGQSLLITLTAIMSVLALTQIAFGELSLVSLAANLVCGPFVSLLLVLSVLFLIFSGTPVIGGVIGNLIDKTGGAMLRISSFFSDVENACVSLEFLFAKIIVIAFTVIISVMLVIKIKRKAFIVMPVVLCSVAFAICFFGFIMNEKDKADIVYLRRGESETFIVTSGVNAALIDVGDGNYSNYAAAWKEAHSSGITELESLVITHYHTVHGYSVSKLFSSVKVRRLMLPYPETKDDFYVVKRLYGVAEKHGVECVLYEREENVAVFDKVSVRLLPYNMLERSVQPAVCFEIEFGKSKTVYVGSSYLESEYNDALNEILADCDNVIYGTHGPNPNERYSIDGANNAKEIVFADEELLLFAYYEFYEPGARIVFDCEIRRFENLRFTE